MRPSADSTAIQRKSPAAERLSAPRGAHAAADPSRWIAGTLAPRAHASPPGAYAHLDAETRQLVRYGELVTGILTAPAKG